jgi:hypothetical protein
MPTGLIDYLHSTHISYFPPFCFSFLYQLLERLNYFRTKQILSK